MLRYSVLAKSGGGELRTVTVSQSDGDWIAHCDCDGFDGTICSHIDATIVAGERAMVPPSDWAIADEAMKLLSGFEPPDYWKGAWRKNLKWRGLSNGNHTGGPRPRIGSTGLPVVCFTGKMPLERESLLKMAWEAGWEATDSPSRNITLLVAADPLGKSRKLVVARQSGIPILSFIEWSELLTALANPA